MEVLWTFEVFVYFLDMYDYLFIPELLLRKCADYWKLVRGCHKTIDQFLHP